jgi:hypothetical protein
MTIKGLDDHLTTQPEQPDPTHWHVSRHGEDDDPFITPDFWTALDYATGELNDLAEFEHEGISANGEMEAYQEAYACFVRSNELDALRNGLKHALDQHSKRDLDENETYDHGKEHRAPLYQGIGGDERIMATAMHAVERVNNGSPMSIWECRDELVYLNDRGDVVGPETGDGIPCDATDYYPPERFTRGDEPAAMSDR